MSGEGCRLRSYKNESIIVALVRFRTSSCIGASVARVLVIHDDAGTLLWYKEILRMAGHHVGTAALGEDGVTAAKCDEFDVVLCDLRLPDISGLEVLRQIRQSSPSTRVVLVTGWLTSESAARSCP